MPVIILSGPMTAFENASRNDSGTSDPDHTPIERFEQNQLQKHNTGLVKRKELHDMVHWPAANVESSDLAEMRASLGESGMK
jgi:hypothetical protein